MCTAGRSVVTTSSWWSNPLPGGTSFELSDTTRGVYPHHRSRLWVMGRARGGEDRRWWRCAAWTTRSPSTSRWSCGWTPTTMASKTSAATGAGSPRPGSCRRMSTASSPCASSLEQRWRVGCSRGSSLVTGGRRSPSRPARRRIPRPLAARLLVAVSDPPGPGDERGTARASPSEPRRHHLIDCHERTLPRQAIARSAMGAIAVVCYRRAGSPPRRSGPRPPLPRALEVADSPTSSVPPARAWTALTPSGWRSGRDALAP